MEQIKITNDCLALEKEWQETCEQCPYATYFHTPEWAYIFSAYMHGQMQPWPRKITFEDGAIAIIPFSRISYFHGLLKQYISSPAGTFGGWLSRHDLSPVHIQKLIAYMQKHPNITWRENPYDPCLRDIKIKGANSDFTQTIDLRRSYDEVLGSASKIHRNSFRRALRNGVSVRVADSKEQWQRHFQGYLAARCRWEKAGSQKSTPGYSWELFEILFNARSPHCKLWLALYKDTITSSVINFYWNHHAVAWHAGAFEEYFDVYPNHLLFHEMVRDAHEKGFHWFDFNPTGDLGGVASFKDRLGTQRISSRVLDKSSLCKKIARVAKNALLF
jgi:Acetyltransferase (GNAT) domain